MKEKNSLSLFPHFPIEGRIPKEVGAWRKMAHRSPADHMAVTKTRILFADCFERARKERKILGFHARERSGERWRDGAKCGIVVREMEMAALKGSKGHL